MARAGTDPDALKDLTCPLCKARGTVRPIHFRRRLRVGLLSFILHAGRTHECTRCGATFSTKDLIS